MLIIRRESRMTCFYIATSLHDSGTSVYAPLVFLAHRLDQVSFYPRRLGPAVPRCECPEIPVGTTGRIVDACLNKQPGESCKVGCKTELVTTRTVDGIYTCNVDGFFSQTLKGFEKKLPSCLCKNIDNQDVGRETTQCNGIAAGKYWSVLHNTTACRRALCSPIVA